VDSNEPATPSRHFYEVRPRKDGHGFYLISERLPYGRLWFHKVEDAVDYGKCYSRSHGAIIRVFDQSGAVVERTSMRPVASRKKSGDHPKSQR
jgi:hypothetical protein